MWIQSGCIFLITQLPDLSVPLAFLKSLFLFHFGRCWTLTLCCRGQPGRRWKTNQRSTRSPFCWWCWRQKWVNVPSQTTQLNSAHIFISRTLPLFWRNRMSPKRPTVCRSSHCVPSGRSFIPSPKSWICSWRRNICFTCWSRSRWTRPSRCKTSINLTGTCSEPLGVKGLVCTIFKET